MKKILTVSVLAMMAVSAANAEIASKGYVDQQIGTLAEGESVATTYQTLANKTTDLSGTFANDTEYPSAKAVKAAITAAQTAATYDDTALAGRVTTAESDIDALEGLVGSTAVATQISTATENMEVNTNKVTSMSASSTDTQYPSAKAVYDAITAAQTAATYDDTALAGRVTTAEGDIDALEEKVGSTPVATQITNAIGTGTLTVQMNGASAGTFGANASENATINLGNVITAPSSACTALNAKCVLTVGSNGYEWEVVQRGDNGQ